MLSDIENLDIMLGESLFDREKKDSIHARRPEGVTVMPLKIMRKICT